MDEITLRNVTRWNALVEADALFTRPALDLTPETAQQWLDPEARFDTLVGKKVLVLAGGGGQQSAAFALLGAQVTVFDVSEGQLARDREAAFHYGYSVETVSGDMRDLTGFPIETFEIVLQPYSLNFVPDAAVVFAQVARVLKPGGIYHFVVANPFTAGLTPGDWNGAGYSLRTPYEQGAKFTNPDAEWVFREGNKPKEPIPPSVEYRQTLEHLLNALIANRFALLAVSDPKDLYPDANADPGAWDHLVAFAPPWLGFWTQLSK